MFVHVAPPSPQQASGAGQLHLETHSPPAQVPPGPQLAPHRPQLFGSDCRFASHPFTPFASQLPNPGEHTKPQTPEAQVAAAFGGVPQATPQPPQLRRSLLVLAHPFGQHASPAGHERPPLQPGGVHTPLMHASPTGQTLPHAPQFAVVERLASQPSPAFPSQSANPGAQENPHRSEVQVATALAGVVHATLQPPQFRTSLRMFMQPLAQHACPTAQVPLPLQILIGGVVHMPPTHCDPATHVLPQAPQLLGSVVTSTHATPHLVSVPAQTALRH